jgi:hypothetical protein
MSSSVSEDVSSQSLFKKSLIEVLEHTITGKIGYQTKSLGSININHKPFQKQHEGFKPIDTSVSPTPCNSPINLSPELKQSINTESGPPSLSPQYRFNFYQKNAETERRYIESRKPH